MSFIGSKYEMYSMFFKLPGCLHYPSGSLFYYWTGQYECHSKNIFLQLNTAPLFMETVSLEGAWCDNV